jgi:L-amino acid N-acyltransferase YncA
MAIRLADENDAEQILAIYAPFCLPESPVSFELEPPSVMEMKERIRNISANFPWLVWEENSGIIGYGYAGKHKERLAYQWSTDLAIYLAPEAKGRGVARILCQVLFELLKRLGYYNIYAGTTLPNPACENLLKSLGCTRVAVYERVGFKAGQWLDVAWYGLALKPFEGDPKTPISIKQVNAVQMIIEAERVLASGDGELEHSR